MCMFLFLCVWASMHMLMTFYVCISVCVCLYVFFNEFLYNFFSSVFFSIKKMILSCCLFCFFFTLYTIGSLLFVFNEFMVFILKEFVFSCSCFFGLEKNFCYCYNEEICKQYAEVSLYLITTSARVYILLHQHGIVDHMDNAIEALNIRAIYIDFPVVPDNDIT